MLQWVVARGLVALGLDAEMGFRVVTVELGCRDGGFEESPIGLGQWLESGLKVVFVWSIGVAELFSGCCWGSEKGVEIVG